MTQPFPVDGRVDIERLRLLLDVQTEYPSLDYKSDCDLKSAPGRYEFVKDVAGMMSRPEGGYLVVGVDGRGQPVSAQLDPQLFDESRLRDLLTKHLEGDFVIASQVHELDGHQVAVLFFGRRPDGLFPIVKSDFSYPDPVRGEVTVLRAGDVFFRDGTSTRRWRSGDLPALLAPYIDTIRRAERSRLGELLDEEIRPALRGQRAAQGPLAALTWRLSEAEFDAAMAELSRQRDDAAIRMLTLQLRRDGVSLMRSTGDGAPEELRNVLDRATSAAATAIVLRDRELFDRVVSAMGATFDAGAANTDGAPRGNEVTGIWLGIATRVLALIALAIRVEEWWAVRPLTLHPVGTTFRRESWLRHALTWGYRTEQMPKGTSGNAIPGALIALARQTVARLSALRLDIADDNPPPLGEGPAQVDPILDSLCQADLLWCVVAAATGTRSAFYPSFSSLYLYRTEPMAHRLLNEPDLVHQRLLAVSSGFGPAWRVDGGKIVSLTA